MKVTNRWDDPNRGDLPPMDGLYGVSNLFYFFFGGSLPAIIIFLIASQMSTHFAVPYLSLLAGIALGWALPVKRWDALRTALAVIVFSVAGFLTSKGLAIMASGGAYGQGKSGAWIFWIQNYILVAILWSLLGIPHRAFKFRLDLTGNGTAQELMLGSLAGLASALAGVSILLLHFDRGALAQVNIKALVAGVIFTSFLIYPVFKALARACWQRGVTGVFSPRSLFEKWHKAALELGMAQHNYYTEKFEQEEQEERAKGMLRSDPVKLKTDGAKTQAVRSNRANSAPRRTVRQPKRKGRSGQRRTRPTKR